MKIASLFFASVLSLTAFQVSSAYAAEGVSDMAASSVEEVSVTISPRFTIPNASHVANGVALRNRSSGWIHLRGVPLGSTVVRAYLYFNFSDAATSGSNSTPVLFDGNRVNGTKTADNADPCWGNTVVGNHTYRAEVTSFIPATNPNEDYEVVLLFNGSTSTTGQNPWTPVEAQSRRLEGATLVVVYSNATTAGKTVFIYDTLNGTMFSAGANTFTLTHPALTGAGLYTMSGADGQRGGGHTNTFSNETGTFDGAQFSGPPVAASDWDGSDGLPLPQLWDVHTHIVALSGGISTVVYNGVGDCLVPVVFVLGNL